MKVKKSYIIYAVVFVVALAVFFAFVHSGNGMCTVSLEGCMLKAKTHGVIGKMFFSTGCVFKNLWCVITSLF